MSPRPAFSCAFPPSRDIVQHARLAADLGYRRIWVYDSPALYGDVWVALARVAEQVPDIGLASGVAIPTLRHPMVTASAIATIEELAPGRLLACFGTGFTGQLTLGQRGMRWAEMAEYIRQLRALLRGETVEINGAPCAMIHSPGWGPARPINVAIGLAPAGPKGFAVSRELADGVVLAALPDDSQRGWPWAGLLVTGSVLDPGEQPSSPRLIDAVGMFYATRFHAMWEWRPEVLHSLPGGSEWLGRIEAERPAGERHLAVHEGHLVTVTERDRALLDVAGEAILDTGWTGDRASVARRFDAAGEAGITEIVYSPGGSDIARELRAFAAAGS